mgnify:CR=1 FL=1
MPTVYYSPPVRNPPGHTFLETLNMSGYGGYLPHGYPYSGARTTRRTRIPGIFAMGEGDGRRKKGGTFSGEGRRRKRRGTGDGRRKMGGFNPAIIPLALQAANSVAKLIKPASLILNRANPKPGIIRNLLEFAKSKGYGEGDGRRRRRRPSRGYGEGDGRRRRRPSRGGALSIPTVALLGSGDGRRRRRTRRGGSAMGVAAQIMRSPAFTRAVLGIGGDGRRRRRKKRLM